MAPSSQTGLQGLRLQSIGVVIVLLIALCPKLFAAQTGDRIGEALLAEGVRLLRNGQAMQAKEKLDEAIAVLPRSAEALTWRGISENQLEQYEAAESDFDAALKFAPQMLAAHYNLALSLIRLQKVDAAIKELRVVVKSQPDSVPTRYNLAILLEGKRLGKEAADELSTAHTLAPADTGVTLHLLKDRLKLQQYDGIESLVNDLRAPSTTPDIQREAAVALIESGRYSEATALLESAHARSSEDTSISSLLARMLLVEDRSDEAKELLAQLPAQGNDAAQIAALNGVALAATHKLPEAILALKTAIELDPSLSLAHNVLGFCLFQQGKYAEAAEAYGDASKLDPKRKLYARDAALAYERANRPAQALFFAERANALGEASANDYLMLGKLYASANRSQDAVKELLHASKLNPNLDSADYLLARTYMKMGDREQAAIWSGRLAALKQKHEPDSISSALSSPVRSSTLLSGGSLTPDEAGAP